MESKRIELRCLFLDTENPRFDPIADEPAIIKALVGGTKVIELAGDLAALGQSPLELLAVMPHPPAKKAYVVLEGNRRVCAAKLLADPGKAPTDGQRQQLKKFAAGHDFSSWSMDVIVFRDRAAARPWILRRHTGQKDGLGSRKWETAAITRFTAQGETSEPTNALALALVEYAASEGIIGRQERQAISLTTVTRMLSTPAVREALGIDKTASLNFFAPATEMVPAIGRFLGDVRTGAKNASSRTNAEERRQYAHQLRQDGVTPATRWSTSQPAQSSPASTRPKAAKSGGKRDTKHPEKRKHVIPSEFKASVKDARLARVYRELKGLDCDEFPCAASSLLRTFIELSVHLFLRKHGKQKPGELHTVLIVAADELASMSVRETVLKPIRVMGSNKDHRTSAHSLGAGVHGNLLLGPEELKRHWDEIEPAMLEILAR